MSRSKTPTPSSLLKSALLAFCLLLFSVACHLPVSSPPVPTRIVAATVPPASPTPIPLVPSLVASPLSTPTLPPPDTGWELLQSGLERRVIWLFDEEERPYERLYLLRLDPALYRFAIGYRPGEARSLAAWQAETGALVVVNGGFFTEELVATGLIVVEGEARGVSYGDFAGMLAITATGPGIRWLAERPYDPQEPLKYALQSFPMLVKPGGQPGYREEDEIPARRTVVAQDRDGRFLFILATRGSFTLHRLSTYLLHSDFNLDIALNLDGGASTGLFLSNPVEEIPAFVPLPVVIVVFEQ